MERLGTAAAAPGEMDTGRLSVGESRSGSPVGLPVAVLNGADDGPTLYLQAASDGDELNGVGVVTRLFRQLDPSAVAGQLLCCGIVNYHGFQQAEHHNPLDDTKINRTYPGQEDGTVSARIAAATFEAASRADLVLDLHQGSTARMIDECRVRCGNRHRLHEECLELAKAFGCGYVLDQKGPSGQLARAAPDEGIPTIDPELGGSVGWDETSIQTGVEGVYNVLRHYEFLQGTTQSRKQIRARGFSHYNADVGGLVDLDPDLGDRVNRGDTLFRITDVFGTVKDRVTADRSGVFWRSRRLPQVGSGEYVCSVGVRTDSY